MKKHRILTRRSFFSNVVGGGMVFGVVLVLGAPAEAQTRTRRSTPQRRRMLLDADLSDPARLPATPRPMPQDPPASPGPGRDAGPVPVTNGRRRVEAMPGPRGRFVICPGHRRCPRRVP